MQWDVKERQGRAGSPWDENKSQPNSTGTDSQILDLSRMVRPLMTQITALANTVDELSRNNEKSGSASGPRTSTPREKIFVRDWGGDEDVFCYKCEGAANKQSKGVQTQGGTNVHNLQQGGKTCCPECPEAGVNNSNRSSKGMVRNFRLGGPVSQQWTPRKGSCSFPKTLTYSGSGRGQTFFTRFTLYANTNRWTETDRKDYICLCLEGTAGDFYTLLIDKEKDISYHE